MKPQTRVRRTGNTEQFSGYSKKISFKGYYHSDYSCAIEVHSKLGPRLLKNISVNSVVNFLAMPFWSSGGDHMKALSGQYA
jgi:hypothetical protein